jgi:hypothetical protein
MWLAAATTLLLSTVEVIKHLPRATVSATHHAL